MPPSFLTFGKFIVVAASVALALYTYRVLLSFINLKKQREDDIGEKTAELLHTFQQQRQEEDTPNSTD